MSSTRHNLNIMNLPAKQAGLGDKLDAVITLLNSLKVALLYQCLSNPALAIGATTPKKGVTITNTTTYLIDGVIKSKTTAEVAFTATVHDIANDATVVREAVYLISLQGDGTPIVTKGVEASGAGNALIPAAPAGECPIGYARVAVDAGATPFDATTNDLDAAHLTVTYVNFGLDASKLGPLVETLT